ncbi:ABC transporter (iron.B12.siderophore.hemin), ATP-binding component [Candidatus Rhodobacter oscarellae]|uniref:ABC transporter (Iron.B12.siderophore.hemin), ATP-binding component n=1 Tax=Candidatus Rhodobacter oscarellae TaxID=1675527 RepID=A0A0J9E7R5_9RHOB|nr:ABC transporter ATP-binding protein [Candidatus Rhodobacter lobularis]KMW58766.1 ABC transporter (iron.B12.siderophore.hemin), ATP-binding component [Candidatus Rhodobacter lobularis]
MKDLATHFAPFDAHYTRHDAIGVADAAYLSVENACWSIPRSGQRVLHPVSFELARGRVLGVVGPNGAGKSTLLRLLYRYLAPSEGCVRIDGIDIWSLTAREVAQSVAAVLQEQPTDFALTVREIVALGRTPHRKGFGGMSGAKDAAIVQEALDRLDLDGFANRRLGTLSGGERQRVMVARALAQQPRLLILDEPTNHLDIRHQLEVLALIRDLPLTIVTSLHDLNMAASACDDVLMLQAGRPLGFGPPDTVLTEGTVSKAFYVTARQERLAPSDTHHLTFHL